MSGMALYYLLHTYTAGLPPPGSRPPLPASCTCLHREGRLPPPPFYGLTVWVFWNGILLPLLHARFWVLDSGVTCARTVHNLPAAVAHHTATTQDGTHLGLFCHLTVHYIDAYHHCSTILQFCPYPYSTHCKGHLLDLQTRRKKELSPVAYLLPLLIMDSSARAKVSWESLPFLGGGLHSTGGGSWVPALQALGDSDGEGCHLHSTGGRKGCSGDYRF